MFFYRVPALRERKAEIGGIVARFLKTNGARWELTDDGMSRLRDHDWPGNIRELRRVVHYCTCFATDGVIDLDLVEEGIRQGRVVTGQGPEVVAEPSKPRSDEAVKRELLEALESLRPCSFRQGSQRTREWSGMPPEPLRRRLRALPPGGDYLGDYTLDLTGFRRMTDDRI
ncbi:MAG: hypothetical protein OXK74_03175, partial [Gemmatimonadota bacterium]|nr:hypothetical protein [Gemmatimonadota bacterium]